MSKISLEDATARLDPRTLRDIGLAEDGSIDEHDPHLRRLAPKGIMLDRLLAMLSLSGTMLLKA
jgi:hypothetical protein